MNEIAGEVLDILRRYLSESTSRSLLTSAARRANVRLETLTRAEVSALVQQLGPGLNIFLQEPEKLQACKGLLARIADGEAPPAPPPPLDSSGAYRSKWGMGAGLRGTKRLVDEFKLDTHPGLGRSPARPPAPKGPSNAQRFVADEAFPPRLPLPRPTLEDRPWLERMAAGAPGRIVWPGLFPRRKQKLARLLLASLGHFDPQQVLEAARGAYASDRGAYIPGKPRELRRYHAHDALACALVHPGLSMDDRHALVLDTLTPSSRGHRSRKKTWAVLRFAFSWGFLRAEGLPKDIVERLECKRAKAALDAHP